MLWGELHPPCRDRGPPISPKVAVLGPNVHLCRKNGFRWGWNRSRAARLPASPTSDRRFPSPSSSAVPSSEKSKELTLDFKPPAPSSFFSSKWSSGDSVDTSASCISVSPSVPPSAACVSGLTMVFSVSMVVQKMIDQDELRERNQLRKRNDKINVFSAINYETEQSRN